MVIGMKHGYSDVDTCIFLWKAKCIHDIWYDKVYIHC